MNIIIYAYIRLVQHNHTHPIRAFDAFSCVLRAIHTGSNEYYAYLHIYAITNRWVHLQHIPCSLRWKRQVLNSMQITILYSHIQRT